MKWLAGMALVVGFAAGECTTVRADDTHVGWIAQIENMCKGEWRAKDGAAAVKLEQKKDHYRFLYAGESVRCDGPGWMVVRVLDREKQITKKDGWYRIHGETAECKEGESGCLNSEAQKALVSFGRAAGRQRGSNSMIFSPAPESTVRVGTLVLKWNEIPGVKQITLRLSDKYHSVLWEQAEVAAEARQLVSEGFRNALYTYRDRGGAGPYTLTLIGAGTEMPAVEFSILSANEERELDKDLRNCDKSQGLMSSVCRTYAYSKRELWNDTANEYEAALKLEPTSTELIRAAWKAERGVGNEKRAAELTAILTDEKAVSE